MSSDTEVSSQDLQAMIVFPPEVEAALQELVDPNDPLDQANFCPTDYINKIFPTEQSLAGLDDVLSGIRAQISQLDAELRIAVQGESVALGVKASSGSADLTDDSCAAIDAARAAIADLFDRMRDIKERADRSEAAVLDLTRDIRRLDTAKRNLTGSITALNQVVILINGVDEMKALMLRTDRPYDPMAQCLGKIHEVTAGLDRFMDIPQLQQLRNEARSLEAELSGRIKSELRDLLTGPPRELQQQRGQVEACCRLADLMEARVRTEVLDKFVQQQLAEYAVLFEETQEAAWLTKIDSRFGWMKKFVLSFEERYARLFPTKWRVTQRLVKEFCDITRTQLASLMQKRAKELDVKLLLFAVERTRLFEEQVVAAFKEKEEPSTPATVSTTGESSAVATSGAEHMFTGAISQCFAPHLGLYTESVDRSLAEMLQRWAQDVTCPLERGAELLPSCADLFMVYKNSLKTCAKLSPAQPMLQLARVFAKYLREYANRILLGSLPTGGRNAQSAKDLFRELMLSGGVGGAFFSESTKLSGEDLSRVCVVICTAEYCLETTKQLEDKLKERISQQLAGQVDLRSERDNFYSVINACVQLLVSDVESACEPALAAMQKMSWNTVEAVGDQSPYVSSIGSHLSTNVPVIRDGLASSRKYFTQFCSKFVSAFAPKFRSALFKCRPVSTVGAEQLLLDTHSLKTLLLSLPSLASPLQRKPPAAFTKLVVTEMTKAEMLMKVVLSEHTNHQAFVDSFCRLLPESDLTEYQKVLDMKGVKRSEQMALIDAYRAAKPNDAVLRPSPSGASLSAAAAAASSASASSAGRSKSPGSYGGDKSPGSLSDQSTAAAGAAATEEGGRMKRLENLLKRF